MRPEVAVRVIVVGGGVIGTTTAYYLARDGHDVELFERGELADGASGVNAGLLVPGDSIVWGTPQAPALLVRTLAGRGAGGIAVRWSAGPSLLGWGLRFLGQCRPARSAANTRHAHALSRYSVELLDELTRTESLQFDLHRDGMVFLFSDDRARDAALAARAQLCEAGESYLRLTGEELARRESAYARAASSYPVVLYTSGAASGDCHAFTLGLAERARARGVPIHERVEVRGLVMSRGRVTGVDTSRGAVAADAVVLAAGASSRRLARSAGVRLPMQPARGLAMTVRIAEQSGIPLVGGVVDDVHVAYSRTATHVRISSTIEFVGMNAPIRPGAYDSIRRVADKVFGDALDWDTTCYHSGFRPMMPTGLPIIGPTRVDGLVVNTGHGHLGWTQACGSARLLADQLAGRGAALDLSPYRIDQSAMTSIPRRTPARTPTKERE